jgi:hypothetical protein
MTIRKCTLCATAFRLPERSTTLPRLRSDFGVGYAILAISGMPNERLVYYLRRWRRIFPKILIVSDLTGINTQWTEPRDLGGMIGFETHQKLLNPIAQWIKRTLDMIAASLGLSVCAPLLGVCALWIRKASRGTRC